MDGKEVGQQLRELVENRRDARRRIREAEKEITRITGRLDVLVLSLVTGEYDGRSWTHREVADAAGINGADVAVIVHRAQQAIKPG